MDENDLKLLETRNQLHAEIERFGISLEKIQNELQEAEGKTVDINKLNEDINSLTITKNDLIASQKEFELLEEKKKSIAADIEDGKNLISSMNSKVEEINSLDSKIKNLTVEIYNLSRDKELAESGIAHAHKESLEKNEKIKALEVQHSSRERELKDAIVSLEAITNHRVSELDGMINDKDTIYNNLVESIEKSKSEINDLAHYIEELKNKSNSLDKEHADNKAVQEKELQEKYQVYIDKDAELVKREGDLSIGESKLEQKRNALISMKNRLEKEAGKSFNIEV